MHSAMEDYREKYGLRTRTRELMSPTNLKYSDTGELLVLLSSLGKNTVQMHEVKINEYFRRSMGAHTIIIENMKSDDCIVRAIGNIPLEKNVIFKRSSLIIKKAANENCCWLKRNHIEGRLLCQIEAKLLKRNELVSNCFVIPFRASNKPEIHLYIVLINARKFFRCEEFYQGVVSECFNHCYETVMSLCKLEQKAELHESWRELVSSYVEIMSSIGTDLFLETIQKQSMKILKAEDSLFYFVNTNLEPTLKAAIITSNHTVINKDEKKLLTSYVIKTGKPFFCNNLRDEPLYGHCGKENPPRNALAFTVQKQRESPLAVLELYDREAEFCSSDERIATSIGGVAAIALEIHNAYMAFIQERHKHSFNDCFLLRRLKLIDTREPVKHILECKEPLTYHRFCDVRFVPTVVPDQHDLCVCFKIFEQLGLLKKFQVRKNKFARFLFFVKNAYNTLPLHNWSQGFATFHYIFVLINLLHLIKNKYITYMEAFALLIAGLCHCLDSRGSTTLFTQMSGTVLPSLLSSPESIAQMNYASQTLRLMNFPECNFLENLSDEMFQSFAVLLIDFFKDSDISNYAEKIQEFDKLGCGEYKFENWTHRRLFHYIIMTASQISSIAKPYNYCRAVGESCFHQIYRKGDLTWALDVYEIAELNEDILKLPDISIQLIKRIGLPTFEILSKKFPILSLCIGKINANLKSWEAEKEKILTEMVKEALGGEGEGDEVVLINPFVK